MRKYATALLAVLAMLCVPYAAAQGSTHSSYHRAQRVIYAVFPNATQHRALAVAGCETGNTYNRWATNRYSGTRGLFQIHPGNHGTTWYWRGHGSITIDRSRLYNSWYNAKVALYMSKGGYDWTQWAPVCRR